MPRDKDLLGSYSVRQESPEIELLLQEEIGSALEKLISNSGLYQKKKVNFDRVEKLLSSLSNHSDSKTFINEFSKRPWLPISPNISGAEMKRALFFCGIGDSPLTTPQDEGRLTFPLPSMKSTCSNCKNDSVFNSIGSIWCDGYVTYYPKISNQTEQVYTLYYRCALCEDSVLVFLIKRVGLSLHLCGRSERLKINVANVIPKGLREIIEDSIGAANENDVFAGFYHLRTFCEHYMKDCCGISKNDRITGDDLCEKYKLSLDNRMTSGMPSMSAIYERASKFMHSRTGTSEDFWGMINDIEGHLQAKELFQKYSSQ